MRRYSLSCSALAARVATPVAFFAMSLLPFYRPIAAQGAAPTKAPPRLEKIKLADNVYVFRAPSAMDQWTSTNAVGIVNDRDVTVYDANTKPSTTRLVIAEIRKITNKPVRTLINSHWHMDHWSGNEVYADSFPGVQIIATTETRDYMKRKSSRYFVTEAGVTPERAALLDTAAHAIRAGKLAKGPLSSEDRQRFELALTKAGRFGAEMAGVRRVLPTIAYRDSLFLWSGDREFRLFAATGDASGSTVLYLPRERILVTGDVLVRQEDGRGAPPWTTNSYQITSWLNSLKGLQLLDVAVIVPGQGPPLYDKSYLNLTVTLFQSILDQVHAALEHGAVTRTEVEAAVKLDSIRTQFTHDDLELDKAFAELSHVLITKAYDEAHDGPVLK